MIKITVAEMRDLESQVNSGEISYTRMLEIINEKITAAHKLGMKGRAIACKITNSQYRSCEQS